MFPDAALSYMQTTASGLTDSEAALRLEDAGLNRVEHELPPRWYWQLFATFANPFVLILAAIAIVSFVVDVWLAPTGEADYKAVIAIVIMILTSVGLGFVQEFRSSLAAEKLKQMVGNTTAVFRSGREREETPMEQLVPGDIVALSAGDMVPADCRIIQSKDLFVSESMLTGESLPAEKSAAAVHDANEAGVVTTLANLCFMGTNIVSGAATAVVVTTGSNTYFGSIGRSITGKAPETDFDIGLRRVSILLIRFMLVMAPVIFLINGLLRGDWLEALLFAAAVAVGLTPEMLPVIVTANLARSAMGMSRQKVVVKRLNAIQNMGAMDLLCTDKTGTLTIDKIVLEQHLNVHGTEDDEVLKWAYLNSFHQTGLTNLMDLAVLTHAEVKDLLRAGEDFTKVDELPFDFQRRRMSVVLRRKDGGHLLICKGAVEEVLDLCTHSFDPGPDRQLHLAQDEVVSIDETVRSGILRTSQQMNAMGLRVLLVAIREFPGDHPLSYAISDESELTLTGFIGFLDPAKPSARPSIEALRSLKVDVRVVTGDNETVTRKICEDVGIPVQEVILGDEVERITDEELSVRMDGIQVFAKISPLQKGRLVRLFRQKGHVVGFLGDGINDSAALKEADVGITVDTAADIAKESSDVILLEKELTVLIDGVIRGRRTFGNIVKYIKMATSGTFGNAFSLLGAVLFLPFLPVMPVQLLAQNVLYDASQISIPWDNMDEDFLAEPRKWETTGLSRFMLILGPVSSIFDYALFAVMFFVFSANSAEQQGLFQTGWFVEGLLSQTLIVHMIRTKKVPFIQSWATAPVVALTSLVAVIGIAIPFTPVAAALSLEPLPLAYFPWLIAILVSYAVTIEFVKKWYIRRFNEWL